MRNSLQRTSQILSLVVIAAGICVLAGWQFQSPVLKGQFSGSFVAPNTALCFVLLGLSVVFQTSRRFHCIALGRVLAGLVLLFAAAMLYEWLARTDLGIDRIFFAHRLVDWTLPVPGRVSVNACIAFVLASLASLALRTRSLVSLSEACGSLVLLIAYLSIIGYTYSVPALYRSGNVMAILTAVIFFFVAGALLTAADGQLMNIITSPYAGGIVARRFLLTIAIVMPMLGMVEIWARAREHVTREFGVALLVLVSVIVFTALALRTAFTLSAIDRQRMQTEDALRYTEQLQTESLRQLTFNLKRLELIEGAVNMGTWEFDPATGISHWPPGISALWGLPQKAHDITLPDFINRIHPEDRERVGNVVQSTLASGDSYEVEFRVIWPDESVHWLSARGAVLREKDGKAIKVLGIALEATERHRTEKALRETEKLAAAGRLAATIAHEINNPLEAVVNLVYLARLDSSLSDGTKNVLDTADVELARVSHMVRQTLGFYRESRNPAWVDLSSMSEELVGLYRNKIQRKNIRLTVRSKPASIHGFEGELRQVLSNLLSNAIDAAPMNGRIMVHIGKVADTIRVTVADNGSGITPENRAKLFQPFFTTKSDVGTGLGLWVSKGIVDKHNGKIRIRTSTKEGASGTVFSLIFPAHAVASAAQSATLAG